MSTVVARTCPLLLVLMSILIGVAPSSASDIDDAGPVAPHMVQYGCRSYYSGHPVPFEWARERVPDGFFVRPFFGVGLGGGPGAHFMVKTWSCERSVVDGVDVQTGNIYLYYVLVTPPADLRTNGIAAYWVPIEIVASSPDEAAVFQAWGLMGSVQGDATIEEVVQGSSRVVHATADSGTNRFDTTFVYPTTGGSLSAFTVRYFAWDGVAVTGYVDIDVDPHAVSGYLSVLDIDGPDDPWGRTSAGTSSTQLWSPEERSYVWTHTVV